MDGASSDLVLSETTCLLVDDVDKVASRDEWLETCISKCLQDGRKGTIPFIARLSNAFGSIRQSDETTIGGAVVIAGKPRS